MSQLTFGLMSGVEKVEPIKDGDIIVNHSNRRFVVTTVADNIHGVVFCCVALDNGAECIVLEREVAYRSKGVQ